MSNSLFWNDPLLEPKRAFRFQLSIDGIASYIVKSSQRPSPEISIAEHSYLNHKFKYPGKVTWNDVDITLVDPIDFNAVNRIRRALSESGYRWADPDHPAGKQDLETISKRKSVAALGEVTLRQISADGDGVNSVGTLPPRGQILDEWKLINAWISNVQFSDLDYESDDLSDITLTLTYDYATVRNSNLNPSGQRT